MKLLVDSLELRGVLERNLEIWNEGCRLICLSLLALRRAEKGEPGRKAWDYISEKSGNWHLMFWLSETPKPTSASEDVQLKLRLAEEFVDSNGGYDERLIETRRLLGVHWLQAVKGSIERVKSYEAKLKIWNDDHEQWLTARAEWEANNAEYMRLRPLVSSYQESIGATRGSRSRWHKWLTYLCTTEPIIKWQNADASYIPPSDEELKHARRNRRHAVRNERDLIFSKNPQLKEFDRLHGAYEREYARTHAKRRHPDGFRQRPTFTLPVLPSRPDWPRFQRDQNWRSLDTEGNTIQLRLLDDSGNNKWFSFRFVPDPRFGHVRKLAEPVKIKRTKYEYAWLTRGGQTTQIEPQGAKLMIRPNGVFLGVSFNIHPPPSRVPYDQGAASKYSTAWKLKKFREHNPDAKIVTCAVDLAIRHLGALSIASVGVVTSRRILHNRIALPDSQSIINVPPLAEIARVQRQLRRSRRKTGKMSPAKSSCSRLQEHYRHMQEDRYKKAAAAICSYAAHYGADFLIFEDLQRLSPDTANERGVNKALANWNRGAIVDFATKIGEDYGLRVVKVPAFHTSRICARCNGVGQRFEQGTRRPFRKPRHDFHVSNEERHSIQFSYLGQWFYCPKCRRRIHADINASENLHRVLLGTFPKTKRDGDFLLVNGERFGLATVKSDAEKQLVLATFGDNPF